jgi:type I restriction enzyme S subunit
MGNLYANQLDLDRSPLFYPDKFAEKYRRFVLREGDLIMSLTGTTGKEDYGFVVEIPKLSRTLLLNQRVARLDLISRDLRKDFLFYFLLSRKFLDHLYPTAKGMKQANLSTNAMKNLFIVVPKISEQLEIVGCFRTLDAKLNLLHRKHARLSTLFRTLLHQLMTAQVRLNDVDLRELEM